MAEVLAKYKEKFNLETQRSSDGPAEEDEEEEEEADVKEVDFSGVSCR